jgi:hypothetical protein
MTTEQPVATAPGELFIGGYLDGDGNRTDRLVYPAADLTTHGVIVGMTGSGKTGLAIGLLEEAILSGIPCLVIDPKGDMGNLLLNFPSLAPEDFRPWVDEGVARREGITADELAARTAGTWREGLESWGITPDRMQAARDASAITIYTPGSAAGVPVNVLGRLAPPPAGTDLETMRAEIEGLVSSILVLAGVQSDPLSGPEHILLASMVEQAWSSGRPVDLERLVAGVPEPGIRKIGVFELDEFFPPKNRTALAMRLNGLLASPSFAPWMTGVPLDLDAMLGNHDQPRVAVMYLSHLSDSERQSFVTLVLSKMVTWVRRQPGTSDLRALIYMDEVFGFCPPTSQPPSKIPILTLAKQARAHGVGMVLATQNPVDFDYKVMSNAGTWVVGRLQTERDKARILEGLAAASGGVDTADLDRRISGLGKRQFVLHTAGGAAARLFTSRWAMAYLAGPLTRDHVAALMAGSYRPEPVPVAEQPPVAAPVVAPGIPIGYLHPAAPWADVVGATAGGRMLRPIAAATVDLHYDDTPAGIDHHEVFEAVVDPLDGNLAAGALIPVDHDQRDFVDQPPPEASYLETPAAIASPAFWKSLAGKIADQLVADRRLEIWRNPSLKLYARPGETKEEFVQRCREAADDAADRQVAALKEKYHTRIDRVQGQLASAARRLADLDADTAARRQQEMLSGAGELLGALLGGRNRSGALSRAANRRSMTQRTEARRDSAAAAVTDKEAELRALEDELAAELAEIGAAADQRAGEIEELAIPLEKVDVKVSDLRLVWVPGS